MTSTEASLLPNMDEKTATTDEDTDDLEEEEEEEEGEVREPKKKRTLNLQFDETKFKDNKLIGEIKNSENTTIVQPKRKKALVTAAQKMDDVEEKDISADDVCNALQKQPNNNNNNNVSVAEAKIKKRKIARSRKSMKLYNLFQHVFYPTLKKMVFNSAPITKPELLNMVSKMLSVTDKNWEEADEISPLAQLRNDISECSEEDNKLYEQTIAFFNEFVLPTIDKQFL